MIGVLTRRNSVLRPTSIVLLSCQLIAAIVIILASAPELAAYSVSQEDGAPQQAIRCANPPNSAEFEELLPCIKGRKVWVTLRSGKSFAGKLQAVQGGSCAAGRTCEVTLSSRFRKRVVAVNDVVSVRYRGPSSARRRAMGWVVGLGATVGTALVMFRGHDGALSLSGGDDTGVGYLAAPLFVTVGAGAGILVGRGRMVTVQLVDGSSRELTVPQVGIRGGD